MCKADNESWFCKLIGLQFLEVILQQSDDFFFEFFIGKFKKLSRLYQVDT